MSKQARARQEYEKASEPGDFGATLGSVWVSVGDLGSLDGHFAVLWSHLGYIKGPFPKNNHFPNRIQ